MTDDHTPGAGPRRPAEGADLRRRAEERLALLSAAASSPGDAAVVIDQLRVHQIELEMQNDELTRAQHALEEQRARYAELFDHAPMGYVTVDDEGLVGEANFTAAHLLGVERRHLVGRPFTTFIAAADQDAYYLHHRRLEQDEEPWSCELRLRRAGEDEAAGDHEAGQFWAQLEERSRDAGGERRGYSVAFADVHERVLAQQALRMRERESSTLIDNAPDIIARFDTALRYVSCNAAVEKELGIPARTLIGKSPAETRLPQPQSEQMWHTLRRALTTGEEQQVEQCIPTPSGDKHFATRIVPERDAQGRVESLLAISRDITARKRAEEERERLLAVVGDERRRLAGLIDSIPDEIWFADAQGRFMMVNPAGLREFGLAAAHDTAVQDLAASLEILRPDGTPRPPEEAPPLRALEGEVVRNLEEIVRTPGSGALRHRLVNSTPVVDEAGNVIGSVSTVRDITDMRLAERAARSERERAQSYLDIAGVMLVAIGADQTVLLANRKACEVLERSEAELVGADWFDATLPEAEREQIRAGFAQLMADNVAPWEYVENRIVTSSGDERLIAWHNTVLTDDDGTIVATLSSGEDITARKQTERLLSAPAEILAILAAPTPMAETVEGVVAALKRATGFDAIGLRLQEGEDYPFLGAVGYSDEFLRAENTLAVRYADGGLCRNADGSLNLECTCGLIVTGRTDPANPLFTSGGSAWTNDSLPFLEVPPEDDPRLNPRNRCIHVGFRSLALVPLRAGDEILGLLHLADRRPDRFTPESVSFFEGLGASIGVALSRKRAEQALRESEEQLLEAHRIAHIGAWSWHAGTDTVTWTDELFRISGRDPAAGVPTFAEHADFVAPQSHARLQAAVERALEAGEPYDLELELTRPDGTVRWVRSLGAALRDDQSSIRGLRGTFQDITEYKRTADEIARLNAELQERVVSRTEQLDAATRELEALAYSMAHDVRAPLRSIDGFSALLMDDESHLLTPGGVENLRRVRAAAQTLARLMDDLVGLSKLSNRELIRGDVDVTALATEVGAETAAENPSRQVDLRVTPGVHAQADPHLLRVILRELLGNAWKFTAPHGSAHVEVGVLDAGGERAFYVRDDGVGFDPRYAKHLFGVFQRMHPPGQFEGDGVGLATVQRLVRRHGGRCWAEAEVEQGATFFFTLPAPA